MVAKAGSDWKLAACLVTMYDQVTAKFPGRSVESDGTIGDRSHAARTSDHNVANGYCHALDLTHDPAHGFSSEKFAQLILDRQDPRLKYVISNKKIGSGPAGPQPGRWRPYNGTNPHNHHCHISVNSLGEKDGRLWDINDVTPVPKPSAPVVDMKSEIKAFQEKHGLTADGLVGPQTWAAIKKEMKA